MSTTIHGQVLINARALIADPARWTTGSLARNAQDAQVDWEDSSARKWCAQGAIYRAAYDLIGDRKKAVRIGNEVVAEHLSTSVASGIDPPFHQRSARPHGRP